MLDPVIKSVDVPCSREVAFKVFIEHVSQWWPLDKNTVSAMDGQVARSVSIEPKVGGRVVEIGHDGSEHHWATVTEYAPFDAFAMDWHIGIPPEQASKVRINFDESGPGRTRVELTHSGWEAFGDKANDMRNGYSQGWVGVFQDAYKAACDRT